MRIAIVSRCSRTLFVFRRSLIQAARAEGEVTALGAGGDGFDDKLREEGIRFQHVDISFRNRSPVADLGLLRSLTKFFRASQTDVCHAFTIKPAIFATLAASIARVPVRVVTITGLGYAFTSAGWFMRKLIETLYRVALRRAQVVFFQNPEDRQIFLTRGLVDYAKARLVAGSGVDTELFSQAPLPSASGKPPTFLMIARLLKDKGVLEYQAAAALLRQRHPQARCLLLGAEDERNPSRLNTEELAALRASHDLTLLGERDDVRPVIAEADVMVLPSYREGLPRSLLEGGAMGRALIATNVPGCRDVVEPGVNGLLVERADAASLAGAMIKLADDVAAIAAFGSGARKGIAERFDERQVIGNTLATYRELLARSRNA
jgi:glycosyltransferase involved in cell wall biosynthesis